MPRTVCRISFWLVPLVLVAVACTTESPATPVGDTSTPTSVAPPSTAAVSATTTVPVVQTTTTTTTTVAPVDPPTAPTPQAAERPALSDALADVFVGDWIAKNLVSAEVWVVDEGHLFGFGNHLELLPGSTEKILTAVGALESLPADHVFRTSVSIDPATDDLVLVAGGDPLLSTRDLGRIAREVSGAGFTSINDLIVDAGLFSADLRAPGWEDWHIPRYTGPLSTLIVDGNRYRTDEAFLADPNTENAKVFVDALAEAGVTMAGEIRLASPPQGAIEIFAHKSLPASDLVTAMLRASNNEIAESLIREIGRVSTGEGSTEQGTLTTVETIHELGADYLGTMSDGSGMSRTNATSARDLIEVLTMVRDQDWFPQFLESLPVAGQSGTLSNRLGGPTTAGLVVAKTGTIIGGVALAGYAPLQDGSQAVFAIIINGQAARDIVGFVDRFVVTLTSVPNR